MGSGDQYGYTVRVGSKDSVSRVSCMVSVTFKL